MHIYNPIITGKVRMENRCMSSYLDRHCVYLRRTLNSDQVFHLEAPPLEPEAACCSSWNNSTINWLQRMQSWQPKQQNMQQKV